MKYLLAFIIAVTLSACSTTPNNEGQIRQILDEQAKGWNSGDIDAYMQAGYWQHDSLLFIGSKGPTYGYDNTLNNYKRAYPNKAKMGQLTFSQLQIRPIDVSHYFVVGKWYLARTEDEDLNGHFTLLFKKIDGQWRIIADHSS